MNLKLTLNALLMTVFLFVSLKLSAVSSEIKPILETPSNYLYVEEITVIRNENHLLRIGLSNTEEIRAVQFDINVPDGFVFDFENFTPLNVLDDFSLSSSDLGNGNYRFLIYTISNNILPVNANGLLDVPIFVSNTIPLGTYTFALSNIVLSDSENQDSATDPLTEGVVQVEGNSAPVALDDTISLVQGGTAVITLVASDANQDALTYAIVDPPNYGSVTLEGNEATYIANDSFTGSDTFTFTASDGVIISEVATITISVTLNVVVFNLQNLKSYPNPFDHSYTINNLSPLKFEIYDITGRILIRQHLGAGQHEIDTSNLISGVYLFKFSQFKISTTKIVVRR
ncbi:Ig-like domain-containing protein [Polaribacter sp.]|jgi:hypothetical protein|nr:Ig-like domain-containing protein [Polaribacter sp.]